MNLYEGQALDDNQSPLNSTCPRHVFDNIDYAHSQNPCCETAHSQYCEPWEAALPIDYAPCANPRCLKTNVNSKNFSLSCRVVYGACQWETTSIDSADFSRTCDQLTQDTSF